ncbi:hypothetical protein STEG23_014989 [Scotinomys teguina]
MSPATERKFPEDAAVIKNQTEDQENPIWIPERLTRFIRHEDPDPDTSDKPDSSPDQSRDQSRTGDAVVGSDQNVADPDANLMRPEMKAE